jgi:hypothetical protein
MAYFGDDRDYFKHDLISWIVKKDFPLCNLVYVPSLTKPRDSKEGNVRLNETCGRSEVLLDAIKTHKTRIDKGEEQKSLEHWRTWYTPRIAKYHTVEPVDATFFTGDSRADYWKKFEDLLQTKNAIVFVDPDTGLETRTATYMRRKGADKYVLNNDLLHLYQVLHHSSILMIYQHLPNNAHEHVPQTQRKLKQLSEACGQQRTIAYRERDLAFLFVAKTDMVFELIQKSLKGYHDKSKMGEKDCTLEAVITLKNKKKSLVTFSSMAAPKLSELR